MPSSPLGVYKPLQSNVSKVIVTVSYSSSNKLLTVVRVPLVVVSMVVVGGVALPSFSQVTVGRGTPLALQDNVTLFHSRAETAGEGSERMDEFATHKGTEI